jgi:aflatoxin B1 aldehyde reductase
MGMQLIFGTMTIPAQTSKESAVDMLKCLIESAEASGSIAEIDTARMYDEGRTEIVLGEILSEHPEIAKKLKIASKVNPFAYSDKTLSKASVLSSALRLKCVDILYLHAPDPNVPIMETLEAIQEIYKAGGFKEFGLSNYQSWEVVHIYHICKQNGWPLPTVYQGMYNCITREVERELFPALRTLNIRFYAYNPLAGGFLSGKHTKDSVKTHTEGRFKVGNKLYRDRYLNESQFEAVAIIQNALTECNRNHSSSLTMVGISMQWLVHHSKLSSSSNDGIIFGASRMEYFNANLSALQFPALLPKEILEAIDQAWNIIRLSGTCPSYERGYSRIQ